MIFLEFNENIPDLILKLSPKKKKKNPQLSQPLNYKNKYINKRRVYRFLLIKTWFRNQISEIRQEVT